MLKKIIPTCIFVLIFLLNLSVYADKAVNLVKNSSFEEGNGKNPTNWANFGGLRQGSTFRISNYTYYSGKSCLLISNLQDSDTMVIQDLNVEKGKVYKVSCWIKTDGIKSQPGSANISLFYVNNGFGSKGIYTSKEFMNTGKKWEKMEFFIKTRGDIEEPLKLALRLGGQGTANKGKAYFDEVEVVKVEQPGEGDYFVFKEEPNVTVTAAAENSPASNTAADILSQSSDKEQDNTMKYILYAIGLSIAMIIIVVVEYSIRKIRKKH